MMWKQVFLGFLLLASLAAKTVDPSVNLAVYYESLCPDSIRYVNTQIFPSWQHFGDDLKIAFKPFGKASFTESESSWNFTCQHGPEECVGNKVQACVLQQVPDPKEYVPLIDCIMRSPDPPTAAGDCLQNQLGITTTTPEKVEACAKSDEGSNLLHGFGVETKSLDPPLYSVPWVLFNNVFDENAWQQSLDNLTSVLCNKFLAGSSKCKDF